VSRRKKIRKKPLYLQFGHPVGGGWGGWMPKEGHKATFYDIKNEYLNSNCRATNTKPSSPQRQNQYGISKDCHLLSKGYDSNCDDFPNGIFKQNANQKLFPCTIYHLIYNFRQRINHPLMIYRLPWCYIDIYI